MEATCEQCGEAFEAQRRTAKFCSTRCRTRATRARAQGRQVSPAPAVAAPGSQPVQAPTDGDVPMLVAATIEELADAGRLSTRLGQHAVQLTMRMLKSSETGSAVASLSKELRATMEAALAGAEKQADPLDELRARRDRRRTG